MSVKKMRQLLNLPQSVPSKNITYTYDASGRKLRKVSNGVPTDYISGIQYATLSGTHQIEFVQTEEGRAIKSGSSYNYEYTLTDHLGNNRVTFDTQSGTANQVGEDDYYPFGLNAPRLVSGNKYLYNKKEIQDDLNGQYDYGARFYDPVIARWTTLDPLAEKSRRFSPYVYGDDNAIRNIDPDGMQTQGCCATPGSGYGSPMGAFQEGGRQYLQAIGTWFDRAYVSVSTSVSTTLTGIGNKFRSIESKYEVTTNVTNTTTVGTNFGEYMKMNSQNIPGAPAFKVTNNTTFTQDHKFEVTVPIEGTDVRTTNTNSVNLTTGKKTSTTEMVAGKAGNGIFVSHSSSGSGSQTDVGVKAKVKTPELFNTSFSLTVKAGAIVNKQSNK
jgi:RHS repeat-associated protein